WQEIKTPFNFQQTNHIDLTLSSDGVLTGQIRNTYQGYDALRRRRHIASFRFKEEFRKSLRKEMDEGVLTELEIVNLEDVEKPLIEEIGVESSAFSDGATQFLLNPFLVNRTVRNPFVSQERLYPVDFGSTLDERITIIVNFPEGVRLENLPDEVGLVLPGDGGHFMLKAQNEGQRV